MKVIVVGAGQVGFHLAQRLSEENQDVILVERESVAHVNVPTVTAVDTTGDGDAFCGVFVAEVASGSTRLEAVERAVHAAAIAVTRPGAIASIPRRDELATAAP